MVQRLDTSRKTPDRGNIGIPNIQLKLWFLAACAMALFNIFQSKQVLSSFPISQFPDTPANFNINSTTTSDKDGEKKVSYQNDTNITTNAPTPPTPTPILLDDSKKDTATGSRFLTCADIDELEIVRVLGDGKHKSTFVVRLPGGGGRLAVAKRCNSLRCYNAHLITKESELFRDLYRHYRHEGALVFYGDCYIFYDNNFGDRKAKKAHIHDTLMDFSVGHTSIVELGKPLLSSWEYEGWGKWECFGDFFTPRDIRDLVDIARRYATLPESPILLCKYSKEWLKENITKGEWSDNIFPQQYVTRIGSTTTSHSSSTAAAAAVKGDDGTIHHADLDNCSHLQRTPQFESNRLRSP